MNEQSVDRSRRAFLTKVAYTAPLIVTLNVMPSIASAGSLQTRSKIKPAHRQHEHHHDRNHRSKWYWR
jgi:hypothetical protein